MVVMENSEHNKPRAAVYWLNQGQLIRKLLEDRNRSEAVEGLCSDHRTFQIAITDLEAATGFGALKAADPLKETKAGREAAGVGISRHCSDRDAADLMP